MKNRPQFQHDCDKCLFLGHYDGFDVYICIASNNGDGSIIARHGDDGPDYASTPIKLLERILSNPECAEVDYVQAWIKAIHTVNTAMKLVPLADTLHEFMSKLDSELAS